MGEIISFIRNHMLFTVIISALNFFIAKLIVEKINIRTSKETGEAMGGRNSRETFYHKCITLVRHSIKEYERRDKKSGFYIRAKDKMKKSGYRSEYAAALYLFFKYALTAALFIAVFIMNYPSMVQSFAIVILAISTIEFVVAGEKRRLNLKFQKYVYKIYKYLHNQISSGVKVTDAIKTVYEVIDDRELKGILIHLAARYELTLDIDTSLEEFKSNFVIQEAETLCVALKQGVMTGDNQEILTRQEDVMFKKYFNYIQAETDSCKMRSTVAAALFTSIIVIMIMVPLFNDVTSAVSKIFVN